MNYGDIITYKDGTRDLHFEEARRWCKSHNVTFDELVEKRNLPNRYFQIGYPIKPTEDEMKITVRLVRNSYLQGTDFTQLTDAPFTDEEKLKYVQYREYLRNYTNGTNWWLQTPKTFEEWKTLDNE